jgi:cell division protein FtsL
MDINYKNVFTSTIQLLYIVYNFSITSKFFAFYQKFDRFCDLIESIEQRLSKKSIAKGERHEKMLMIALAVLACVIAFYVFGFYQTLFASTERNVFAMSYSISVLVSEISSEIMIFLLEFSFINISIHICLLLEQIEDDLQELNEVQDEVGVRAIIGRVSDFHFDIQQITNELLRCFENVIIVIVATDVLLAAQAATFLLDSNWWDPLIYDTLYLVEIWMYCYGVERIISKV